MDEDAFAADFESRFRQVYALAARRVRDKRALLPPATLAFLSHLAAAGPMTLSELAKHLDRAPSTLSEMVDHLEHKNILRREPDPADKRRALIWLTREGRARLTAELSVLDIAQLARAGAALDAPLRAQMLAALDHLIMQLAKHGERK